jgi:hypothetical protein
MNQINFSKLTNPEKSQSTHTLFLVYKPIQLVAPRAVKIAVATDAIICTIHLTVSFFVIIFKI